MKTSYHIILITIVTIFILVVACSKVQEDPPQKDPPIASFTVNTEIARISDTIYFQNTSAGADNFDWDFGDGNYSTEENPWHTYSEIGTYSILLKVSNKAGSDESMMDIRISLWSAGCDIPTSRGMHSSSVVDGKIYVISGGSHYGGGALYTVEKYNPETDTWSARSDIPTPRQCLTTSVVDGKIYAIGGGDSPNSTDYQGVEVYRTVEEYDPATDTWSTKSPMPAARWIHSAPVVNGKIYIIGGTVTPPPFKGILTMVIYDPESDTWSSTENIPRPIVACFTAVVDGKIYVIGGATEGNLNRVDEYDPVKNIWIQKADMPSKRYGGSCSVLDGKIYVIGGETETYEIVNTVEVYDPETDTWAEADPLLRKRWSHSSCTVNGKIYVISGLAAINPYPSLKTVEVYYE